MSTFYRFTACSRSLFLELLILVWQTKQSLSSSHQHTPTVRHGDGSIMLCFCRIIQSSTVQRPQDCCQENVEPTRTWPCSNCHTGPSSWTTWTRVFELHRSSGLKLCNTGSSETHELNKIKCWVCKYWTSETLDGSTNHKSTVWVEVSWCFFFC